MKSRKLIGTNLIITQTVKNTFNLDTVLLGDFVKIPPHAKKVIDFGTGNGGVLLYLSQKTKAQLIGIEVQQNRYELALKNVEDNSLSDQITILHQNIKDYQFTSFADVVVANPPFNKVNNNRQLNQTVEETIARHEVLITLSELIAKMSKQLNNKGLFYLIHRPERLAEIQSELAKHNLVIKRLRLVHPYLDKPANHILIEAVKSANSGLTVEPPLIIYDAKHQLSANMQKIYQGENDVTTKS